MSEKPLFIPLKGQWYNDFENGSKDTEYRLYGPRWNERTCRIGRPVILSYGYGKKRRMRGVVAGFYVSEAVTQTAAWRSCYPNSTGAKAACIRITILRNT